MVFVFEWKELSKTAADMREVRRKEREKSET